MTNGEAMREALKDILAIVLKAQYHGTAEDAIDIEHAKSLLAAPAQANGEAMRGALERIAGMTCACHDSADENWHGERCPKGIALKALAAPVQAEREKVHETIGYETEYMRGRREMREELGEVQADAAAGEPGADGILKRIALRYKNCMVNIYPDLPELTPVEGVLRCAAEEGFVLAARPGGGLRRAIEIVENEPLGYLTERDHEVLENFADRVVAKLWLAAESPAVVGASAEQAEQDKIGRLTGGKCIEALASRREIGEGRLLEEILQFVDTQAYAKPKRGATFEDGWEAATHGIVKHLRARAALAGERAETP